MKSFRSYHDAEDYAIDQANASDLDVGIERNPLFGTFQVFFLPRPENRQGHELRCQVVTPGTPKARRKEHTS
jgi:hypothetical protein